MAEYRHTAHATYDLKYHLIWITKYLTKILRGCIAERARDLIRQIYQSRDVIVIRGAVSSDHIHMLVSVPPQLAPMKLVQYIVLGAITGGVSGTPQAVLGPAPVGARVILRDGRRRGQSDDQSIH
jgi:hypothetical protein